jgi:HlyD family secretion protein
MSSTTTRFGWLKKPWVIIIIVLLVGVGVYFGIRSRNKSSTATTRANTVKVVRGNLTTSITGSGNIIAASDVTLAFQTSGTVSDIMVKEGDKVQKGQALAKLDSRDLELQLKSAQASYDSAKAKLAQLTNGATRSSDLTSAQAAVASAQAQLSSAQERLDALKNPSPDKISAAELKVKQAETNLSTTRDSNSAAKTKAELDLSKASESLIQAQSKYGKARWDWDWVQKYNSDPVTGKGGLSGSTAMSYQDAYTQADASVRSAEQGVQQAQITLDNAKTAEADNITQAEQTLKDAQIQLTALQKPTASDIAAAVATVSQNQASLAQAQASLDKIVTPGTESDVAIQQAAVVQAESALEQAKLKVENATLSAPFDGVVNAISLVIGQTSSGGTITMINREPMHIDLKLSETDIVSIKQGQSADITVDAVPDWNQTGTVTSISPAADTSSGVVTYKARVDFSDKDPRILVGMTSMVNLVTAQRNNALLIPNSAILPKGTGRVVQVYNTDGSTKEIDVTIGLSDGIQTEVLSGLTEGQTIIATPVTRSSTTSASRLP